MKTPKQFTKEAPARMGNKQYMAELRKLQVELCKLQDWVKHKGLRVIVVFEGRDNTRNHRAGQPARVPRSSPASSVGP
jgi:polyphosphate kinase 2 (PPK2 family)